MQRRRAGAVNRAHVGAALEQVRDAGAARRGDVERRAAPRVPRVHVTFARVVVAERPRVRRAPETGVPPGAGSSEAGATRKEARAERDEDKQQEEYQDYESNEDTGGESNSEEDTEIGEFFQPPEKKVYSLSINYTSQYTLHLRDIKHVSE